MIPNTALANMNLSPFGGYTVWWPGRHLNMLAGLEDMWQSETTCSEWSGSFHTHITRPETGSVSVH